MAVFFAANALTVCGVTTCYILPYQTALLFWLCIRCAKYFDII